MRNNKQLLHTPEGVRDIYGKEYKRKLSVEQSIRSAIDRFGYEAIQTPTFEYFDVFSREVGTTPSKDLYKLIDKDGHTLVLRPDFTPSIARCAAKYFMNEEAPLRFTYEGNTFVNVDHLQGKLKECTQMGAELIMDDSVQADAEMIAMTASALKAAGLSKFQITIGHMEYFKGLCQEAGLEKEDEFTLREYISNKNMFAARDLMDTLDIEPTLKNALLEVADLFGSLKDLSYAKSLVHNSRSIAAIERLEQLKRLLEIYGVDQYVSFDLGILSKYQYYTGIVFRAYTYGIGDAIAKGGRYDGLLRYFGKDAAAVGFVMVIDDILEALEHQKIEIPIEKEPITVFYTEEDFAAAVKEAAGLRAQGRKVILMRKGKQL